MTDLTEHTRPRARAVRANGWDLSSNDPLDPAELAGLVREYKSDRGTLTRNRIVESHLRLVAQIAWRHAGRGTQFEDLMPEGALALIRALDNYDPERGVSFTSYASVVIEHAVRSAAVESGGLVKLPSRERRRAARRFRREMEFFALHGRAPSAEDLMAWAREAPEDRPTGTVRLGPGRVVGRIGDAEDAVAAVDTIADGQPSPAQRAEAMDDAQAVESAVKRLPPSAAEALALRFGLGGTGKLTVAEIAAKLRLSQRAVDALVTDALKTLRREVSDSRRRRMGLEALRARGGGHAVEPVSRSVLPPA